MPFCISFEGREFRVPDGESVIGRDGACEIRLDDPSVSRRHARVLVVNDRVTIEDLRSKNGVKLNGHHISAATPIHDGDIIRIGNYEFRLKRSDLFDVEDTTRQNIEPIVDYHAPIYRTCLSCRNLLEASAAKCEACGAEQVRARFATVRFWRDPEGRRRFYRKNVTLRALYVSPAITIEGSLSDLSTGGAFFTCDILDEIGTTCDLLVFPAEDSEVVRFTGEVARACDASSGRSGMGLRFIKMTSAAQLWVIAASEPPDDSGAKP